MEQKKLEELKNELSDNGYIYISMLSYKDKVSHHHIKSKQEYMAKIIDKRDLFKYRELKNAVNREYLIADTIKRNFGCFLWFYDFFYTKSYAIFLYEYCKDGTLEELISDEDLKMKHKKIITKDIIDSMKELKFLGIIHRNLHPSHIYISKYSLKIGGYEFCEMATHREMDPLDFTYFLDSIENIGVLAPEITFNKVCSIKTPLYSLGVIIYRLLNKGKYPLEAQNIKILKNRYLNKDYDINISPDIEKIEGEAKFKPVLFGLLATDPHERMSYVDLEEFKLQIQADINSHEDEPRYMMLNKKRKRDEMRKLKGARKFPSMKTMNTVAMWAIGYDHGNRTPEPSSMKKSFFPIPEDGALGTSSLNISMEGQFFAPSNNDIRKGLFPVITPYQEYEEKKKKEDEKKRRLENKKRKKGKVLKILDIPKAIEPFRNSSRRRPRISMPPKGKFRRPQNLKVIKTDTFYSTNGAGWTNGRSKLPEIDPHLTQTMSYKAFFEERGNATK